MHKLHLQARLARNPAFSPFRHRTFLAIWLAALISNFGSVIQAVAAAWLMATITNSPDYVALVQAASMAPLMLFALLTGALADTFDRRRVMIVAQTVMVIASSTLAALSWLGYVSPWSLLFFTFMVGFAQALYTPAWQSSIAELVTKERFPAAIGLNSVSYNIARSVAPALGGGILVLWGVEAAFLANALSTLGLVVVLARWKRDLALPALPPERLDRAVISGVRYVVMSPTLRSVLVRAGLFGLFASALQALLPIVARDLVSGGALTFGFLLGAFGVGAMIGGVGSVHLRIKLGEERLVHVSTAAFGIASILVGVSPWLTLSLVGLLVAGAAWVLVMSNFNIAVQTSAPRWVTGRALAAYQMAAFGGISIGSVLSGVVANTLGTRYALVLAGIAMLGGLYAGYKLARRPGEVLDQSPYGRALNTLPELDLDPRTGPIVVTVEYRVPEADARAFVSAARKLGRLRRADGAWGWTLIQNLDDRQVWIERFHAPTWLDHLRRQSRMTVSSQIAQERARAFSKGGPVVVRRFVERPNGAPPLTSGTELPPEPTENAAQRQQI